MIRVTDQKIDLEAALGTGPQAGACVTFQGFVRNDKAGGEADIKTLTLEHWPGATERALEKIEAEARSRFDIADSLIIHRYGPMEVGEMIVLVATWSSHREAAFNAARFLMDYLKTDAPFWKKVTRTDGREEWVEAKQADDHARQHWGDDFG